MRVAPLTRPSGTLSRARERGADYERRRYLEKVVPQMSLALPEPERAQVCMDFERELERLG